MSPLADIPDWVQGRTRDHFEFWNLMAAQVEAENPFDHYLTEDELDGMSWLRLRLYLNWLAPKANHMRVGDRVVEIGEDLDHHVTREEAAAWLAAYDLAEAREEQAAARRFQCEFCGRRRPPDAEWRQGRYDEAGIPEGVACPECVDRLEQLAHEQEEQ